MTTTEERSGGRLTFAVSLCLAFFALMGGVCQVQGGMPNAAVWILVSVIAASGAVIGGSIGFYNMGRMRGR